MRDNLIDILDGVQTTTVVKTLTAKQSAFVAAFCNPASIVYNNATQSMIKAGYAKKYANRNVVQIKSNKCIKTAIHKYRAKIAAKMEVTRELQEQRLNELYLMAVEQENVQAARSVLAELNSMAGYNRERAPNLERVAEIRQRMDTEEIKYRQEFTVKRCTQEAGQKDNE